MRGNEIGKVRQWHPLCKKQIDFTLTWQECREKLDEAVKGSEIVEALHNGFDAGVFSEDEFRERIFYYLKFAYGHDGVGLFFLSDQRRDYPLDTIFGRQTTSEARKETAKKAWAMLCQNVFRNENKEYETPSWWRTIAEDPEIIDRIVWFFLEKDNIPSSINTNEYNRRIALDFLCTFARSAWRESAALSLLPHFVENRPRLIEILSHLEKTDLLIEEWRGVTQEDLITLEKISLFQGRDKKREGPKYKTIEEAAVGGSQSARVLMVLKAMLKERDRQEEVREAEREMKEAEKKIKALNA